MCQANTVVTTEMNILYFPCTAFQNINNDMMHLVCSQ